MENKTNETQIKPPFNVTWFIFIALLGIGYILNYELFQIFAVNIYIEMNIYLFLVLAFVVGYVGSILVYGLGKFIAAKIFKYKLIEANVLGFRKRKVPGGYKKSFGLFEGLGFQLFYAPFENQDKIKKYHLSGLFATLIYEALLIIAIVILNIFKLDDVVYFLIIVALFPPFILTAYLFPSLTDILNDGYILKMIKDKKAKEYYLSNLINDYSLRDGKEIVYKEVLESDYHPFVLNALLFNYYFYLDKQDLKTLEQICDFIISKEKYIINQNIIELGYIGRIYILCEQGLYEKTTDYYYSLNSSKRKFLRSKTNLDSVKSAMCISAFLDVSWEVYSSILTSYEKDIKNYLYPSRVENEIKMIKQIIATVEEKYPDWRLDYDGEDVIEEEENKNNQ